MVQSGTKFFPILSDHYVRVNIQFGPGKKITEMYDVVHNLFYRNMLGELQTL